MSRVDAVIATEALRILRSRHKELLSEIARINIAIQCMENIRCPAPTLKVFRNGKPLQDKTGDWVQSPQPVHMTPKPPSTGRKGSTKAHAYEVLKDGRPRTTKELREDILMDHHTRVVPVTLRGALNGSPDLFQKVDGKWSLKHK